MASPMVSGVVALVQSVAPKTLSAAEMRTLITQNAQPFPKGLDQPLGSGILDATATVTAAKSGVIPAAADFTCSQSGSGMNVTCTDLSTARGKASIRSWAWNFDSGNSADLTYTQSTNPTHQYGFPGTYKVSLTTTDSTGAVSRLTLPVVVNAPATIDINANQSYTINAKANVPQYYKLQLPDGMSYANINFASLYTSESGTMYVRTDALSNANMCTQTFSRDAGGGGGAACYFWNNPKGGAYYIILSPDTDISNAQMAASYVLK
jgi:serine protease